MVMAPEQTLTDPNANAKSPVRAPCPMLNTLANHGFLPHHGKDITREVTENALFDALNINKTLGSFLFDFALTTNPVANSTTFSLNDLGNHNVLEHDASLRYVSHPLSPNCRPPFHLLSAPPFPPPHHN